MWFKYPFTIVLFFLFVILQTSFLTYFDIIGAVPNIVFILFFILVFFEDKNQYDFGFWTAVVAGFFLDVFLPSYFGISIISLLIVYFLVKISIQFLKEWASKFPIFYFIPIFLGCFFVHNAFLQLSSWLFGFPFHNISGIKVLIAGTYNLVIASGGFYIYKKLVRKNNDENQLKLL